MMLLEKLVARQRELDMTDEQFANALGVSRALWQGTRTGSYSISESVLRGVRRAFPEFIPEILDYLADKDPSEGQQAS